MSTIKPNHGLTSEYVDGFDGWTNTMNQNLNKVDATIQMGINGFVADFASLPALPSAGDRYILSDTSQLAVYHTAWTLFAPSGGWYAIEHAANRAFYFNGTAWVDFKNIFPSGVPAFGINGFVADFASLPGSPSFGDAYILNDTKQVAYFTAGWELFTPFNGWVINQFTNGDLFYFDSIDWINFDTIFTGGGGGGLTFEEVAFDPTTKDFTAQVDHRYNLHLISATTAVTDDCIFRFPATPTNGDYFQLFITSTVVGHTYDVTLNGNGENISDGDGVGYFATQPADVNYAKYDFTYSDDEGAWLGYVG